MRLLRSVLADFSGAGTSAGGLTSFAGATSLVEVLARGLATGPILLTLSGTFVGMPGLGASDAEREVARDTMGLFIVALAFDSLATFDDSERLLHWKGAGPAPEEEERRLLRVRSFVAPEEKERTRRRQLDRRAAAPASSGLARVQAYLTVASAVTAAGDEGWWLVGTGNTIDLGYGL